MTKWMLVFLPTALFLSTSVSHAENHVPERNEQGERVWTLNSFLKGTANEIYEILNKEVHIYQSKLKDANNAVEADKSGLQKDRTLALEKQLDRQDYRQAKDNVEKYKDDLEIARSTHDMTKIMQASKRYNDTRQIIAKIEKLGNQAADNDYWIKLDNKKLADDQARIPGLVKGLSDATKWHDDLVDAVRNTFLLEWPAVENKSGCLGIIVPKRFTDDGSLVCSFKLRETVSVGGKSEGVVTVQQLVHPVTLIIKDCHLRPSDVDLNHPTRFDHNVEVISSNSDLDPESELLVNVVQRHGDLDDLLDAVAKP